MMCGCNLEIKFVISSRDRSRWKIFENEIFPVESYKKRKRGTRFPVSFWYLLELLFFLNRITTCRLRATVLFVKCTIWLRISFTCSFYTIRLFITEYRHIFVEAFKLYHIFTAIAIVHYFSSICSPSYAPPSAPFDIQSRSTLCSCSGRSG